ncbi:hypothetical protein JL720_10289 [Aureococcus anophagefferens]|nr:hypothetical protein JL720_10289 [Aureococcus anophagefferens]
MRKCPPSGVLHKQALWEDEWRPALRAWGAAGKPQFFVKFAVPKAGGGWFVSWSDNTTCEMDDDEREAEAREVARAAEAARAAEVEREKAAEAKARQAELRERAREERDAERERKLVEAQQKQLRAARELEEKRAREAAERERREAAARAAAPRFYDAEDVEGLMPSYGKLADAGAHADLFAKELGKLRATVSVTKAGVAHGYGVVARRRLEPGEYLVDPTAIYCPGRPDEHQSRGKKSEAYILNNGGYWRIHWFQYDDVLRSSATYWLNEARGGAKPNVTWGSHPNGHRNVMRWRVLRPVKKGEELFVSYNAGESFDDDDDDGAADDAAAAEAAGEWRAKGPYVGMWVTRSAEHAGKEIHCVARIEGFLPESESDYVNARGEPSPLWRAVYVDGVLAGDHQDLEEYEILESAPRRDRPVLLDAPAPWRFAPPGAAEAPRAAKPKKAAASKAKAPAQKAAPVSMSHLKAVKRVPQAGQAYSSQYVGIGKCDPGLHEETPWRAQIYAPSQEIIGYFATEMEAVRAYDARARELGKPMNFPDEVPAEASVETDASDDAEDRPAELGAVVETDASDDASQVSEGPPKSQYVGVTANSQGHGSTGISSVNPWRAQNNKDGNIGVFPTEEEAARAYDARARRLGRPVNFPKKGETPESAARRGAAEAAARRPAKADGAAPARGSASSGRAAAARRRFAARRRRRRVLDRVVAPFGAGATTAASSSRRTARASTSTLTTAISRRASAASRREQRRRCAARPAPSPPATASRRATRRTGPSSSSPSTRRSPSRRRRTPARPPRLAAGPAPAALRRPGAGVAAAARELLAVAEAHGLSAKLEAALRRQGWHCGAWHGSYFGSRPPAHWPPLSLLASGINSKNPMVRSIGAMRAYLALASSDAPASPAAADDGDEPVAPVSADSADDDARRRCAKRPLFALAPPAVSPRSAPKRALADIDAIVASGCPLLNPASKRRFKPTN